jgi:hypothetical protein
VIRCLSVLARRHEDQPKFSATTRHRRTLRGGFVSQSSLPVISSGLMPQPINSANIAKSRFPRSVFTRAACRSRFPSSALSQLPVRTPTRASVTFSYDDVRTFRRPRSRAQEYSKLHAWPSGAIYSPGEPQIRGMRVIGQLDLEQRSSRCRGLTNGISRASDRKRNIGPQELV